MYIPRCVCLLSVLKLCEKALKNPWNVLEFCVIKSVWTMSDKLYIRWNKRIVGVGRRSVNFSVKANLVRHPIHFGILSSMLKYWHIGWQIGKTIIKILRCMVKVMSWLYSSDLLLMDWKTWQHLHSEHAYLRNRTIYIYL